MGFYMLNISIDTTDPTPSYLPEDLSFNDQESIVELVVEQFLGYQDSIAEYDDNDTEDYGKKKNVSLSLLFFETSPHHELSQPSYTERASHYPDYTEGLLTIVYDTDSPPPKG